jgi:hypothetical protein
MANFKQDILDAVGKEQIEAISILDELYSYGNQRPRNAFIISSGIKLGKAYVDYHAMLNFLDYEYNSDSDSQDCHDIYVWTNKSVFYVYEYNGSTWLESVPRNPTFK